MKNTIETPKGCKIAKTEIIDGNVIVTYERDLPESVHEIPGKIFQTPRMNFSTSERAEAILALGQLLELASYVGGIELELNFHFKDSELIESFSKKYSDLFEKAEKLL